MPDSSPVTYRQMVTGSVWMIAMRWAVRSIGLVSTAILARILVPEDFGLVAMATMMSALIHTFSELGTARLLIRIAHPSRAHYDTAWTIIVLQGLLIAGLLYACAPLAAEYFSEPRVVPVIRWMAVTSVIAGFSNIGIINIRKELRFRTDFTFELSCKLSSFIATVSLALYLRSYWALVAGAIATSIVGMTLSYVFHEYRPRPSLALWREFARFSAWITPTNIALYFVQRSDALIVGAATSASQLGLYHFASEVSKMATNEVIFPMGRALYPAYAKLIYDRERLAETFMNVVRTVALVSFATGPGLAVVAEDFVWVLLGEKWAFSIPLMRFLAMTGALGSMAFVLKDQIFVVTSNERFTFALTLLQMFIAVPTLVLVGMNFGMQGIAAATTGLSAVFVLLAAANVHRAVPIAMGTILRALVRPMIAAVFMVSMVTATHADFIDSRPVTLALDILVGAASYVGAVLVLWKLAGSPDGVEKGFVEHAKSFLARVFGAPSSRQ